jgi:hypothetical protein
MREPTDGGATTTTRTVTKVKRVLLVVLLVSIGVGGGMFVASRFATGSIVPTNITKGLLYPLYIPKDLPGTYVIDRASFQKNQGVVIVSAKDNANGVITMTQQAKPAKLNFTDFYQQQMTDAKTLDHVPFPSVLGLSPVDKTTHIMSVVTDHSWIIVTTKAPISEAAFQELAASLEAQTP